MSRSDPLSSVVIAAMNASPFRVLGVGHHADAVRPHEEVRLLALGRPRRSSRIDPRLLDLGQVRKSVITIAS